MTTRTRWTVAAILNLVAIACLWALTASSVAAKQDQPDGSRLREAHATSSTVGTAVFITDTKSGGCWLWLRRSGATLLAPAPPAACE